MRDRAWPVIVDGEPRADGRVDLLALGGVLSTGEGLFETVCVTSDTPLFWKAHLERLREGADALRLSLPADDEAWRRDVGMLLSAAGTGEGAVRLMAVRDGADCRRIVSGTPLPKDAGLPVAVTLAPKGLEGPRLLARHKTTGTLLSTLALAEAAKGGFDEALFFLPDGGLLEGTRSSVFLVRKGTLLTPPLDLPILPGVTRAVLLEERVAARDLLLADEAFLSASVRGLRPIRRFMDREWATVPGPVTERLVRLYAARILRDHPGIRAP